MKKQFNNSLLFLKVHLKSLQNPFYDGNNKVIDFYLKIVFRIKNF
jgi:hypothetical protein